MPDESKQEGKIKADFDSLEKKIKKKGTKDTKELIQQLATREKLERDYKEDIIKVTFNSSPETKRAVLAKRPTQKEMMTIMRLSAEAAIYEGKSDPESLQKMLDIYDQLPELAASLSVDKSLNKDFWTNKVSFATLQNFITELIRETQRGTGIPPEEMQSFP